MFLIPVVGLFFLLQEPSECLGARSVAEGPYCFATVYADRLLTLAEAKQAEHDSTIAAIHTGNLHVLLTTAKYWQLERDRLAQQMCDDLLRFDVRTNKYVQKVPAILCLTLERMSASDSAMLEAVIGDIEHPGRVALSARATRDAARQQNVEKLSRDFTTGSLALSFFLLTSDPKDPNRRALDLTEVQRQWLVEKLRRGAEVGPETGVFGQIAGTLADWLTSGWPLAR